MQPEDVIRDELQYIEDYLLSTPTAATTITQSSQVDDEETASTSL